MALEIESPHRSIFDIESLSTMADTPIGLGNRLCAKLRPRYDHGLAIAGHAMAGLAMARSSGRNAAQAAGWPRLAGARGSLERDLALREERPPES